MPRASIITPCFNAARFVGQTIESVRAQSFEDWEYIVVDDGSTDETPDILRNATTSDPRVTVVSQRNSGCASARNRGLASMRSGTEFVAFLDADDLWYPDTLGRLVRALDEDVTAGVALGYAVKIDEEGTVVEDRGGHDQIFRASTAGVVLDDHAVALGYDHFLPVNPILSPGQCLIGASALADGPRFDETVAQSEDWDLWLQLSRSTRFLLIDEPTLMYRKHPGGKSTNYKRMHEFRSLQYAKQFRYARGDPELLAKIRAAYLFGMFGMDASLCARWARDAARRGRPVDAARFATRSFRYSVKRYIAQRSISRLGTAP